MEQTRACKTRKTRFVCVSDTHNGVAPGSFRLPQGDVLIHAGDLTNQGSYAELQKALKWIEDADFEQKIVIAGNHDITLDSPFYDEFGLYFHNQNPQNSHQCRELFEKSKKITYLNHEAAVINLTDPGGPGTTFNIFGSPYSPAKGQWAFSYQPEDATQRWADIPLDVDIVVTHTPPKVHCDESKERRAAGCEALRCMLWRVRPRLAICGHVHEGRGAEIVKWDLGMANIKYKEMGVERWEDPGEGNKKVSLIDLTNKSKRPLLNDGSIGQVAFDEDASSTEGERTEAVTPITFQRSASTLASPSTSNKLTKAQKGVAPSFIFLDEPQKIVAISTHGQGGIPPSNRCDLEALAGRLGRKETFVVNAAIMASSWPHNKGGGKKFNKPIVVDVDLPYWDVELERDD